MSFSLTKSLLKRTNLHKNLLQTRRASGGHGHEPEFNEPSGYLFGEKPPPPGRENINI
ncbi:420_t:CDS:2 [Entrophospora sp. SA101]|nr:420_t:CDS:2 [Entrophospora sp. SA101]CAJ0891799.1 13089_t:CDS:2 [Entrophospora sp. SA101]